jgi:hypothetical protein
MALSKRKLATVSPPPRCKRCTNNSKLYRTTASNPHPHPPTITYSPKHLHITCKHTCTSSATDAMSGGTIVDNSIPPHQSPRPSLCPVFPLKIRACTSPHTSMRMAYAVD